MENTTALVTGGGSGMGEAICRRMARDGMSVGILDINNDAANGVAKDIINAGGKALAVQADIANREQVVSAIEKVRHAFGPITTLVNNAGIESFTAFDEISDERWDRMMSVNLKGAYIVTQLVLPDMKTAQWGRIVNLASMAAQTGAANMVDYAASKGGIIAMTRSLAIELGRFGITVNAIAPGFILTPMAQRSLDQGYFPIALEDLVKTYPIPRIGQPEEIAAACAYFTSREAGYTSGQVLGVNGATCM